MTAEATARNTPALASAADARRVAASRGLLGSAAVYTLANIANSAIPFVLLPLLTRVLSPQDYGLVAIFTSLVTAFGAFAGLSVHGAVNVRFFDQGIEHPRYVGTAFAVLGLSTLATLVGVAALSPWLTAWTMLPPIWLGLAVVVAAAQFVVNIRLVMWQVNGQPVRYGTFQVLQTGLNLGLSILLILVFGLGWQGRVGGLLTVTVAFALFGALSLHHASQLRWTFDRAYARDALRFGVPLIPHVLGSLLIAASDRLMVANQLSVAEAGIYAAGMQVGMVITVLAEAGVRAIGPWMFANLSRNDRALDRRIVRFSYIFFAAVAAGSLIFGALAPKLLLLVGERFRSGEAVVAYIALGGAFSGMYLIVVNYIFYAKRNELLALTSVSVGVFNLGLTYLLIGHHGAVGAAQAYAISQFIMFIVVWRIAAKCHPMPWLSAWRIRRETR